MSETNNTKSARPHKVPFFVRLAAWGIVALLSLALLAIVALHLPPVQKEIILKGVGWVEASTNFSVQIRSYRWLPFSGIYLTDVKIESEGKPILDCNKIRLKYALSIERPYLLIQEVYLEKPLLQLERSADGKWLVPMPPLSKVHGNGVPVNNQPVEPSWTLPRIQIVSGTIEARQQGNTVLSIKDISGAVHLRTVRGAEGPKIQMEFENVHAQTQSSKLGSWKIDGSGVFDGRELHVHNVILAGPDNCRVMVGGEWDVANLDNGRADLIVTGFSTDSVPMLRPHLNGLSIFSGKITVMRSGDRWSFEHDLSTDLGSMQGVLGIEKTSAGRRNVALDSQFAGLKVHLARNLPDSSLNGRIGIKAAMEGANLLNAQFTAHLDHCSVGSEAVESGELDGTFADSVLKIKSSDFKCSFADLKFMVIADLRGLSDVGHKGGVKADVSLEKGNLEKINLNLQQRVAGRISLDANYDPGNFTNLRLWQAKIDARLNVPETVSLNCSGTFNNQQIKADYDIDLMDVQKIALLFPRWQGKGRVASRGSLSGKWPDLFWDGELNWLRFQYLNFQADQVAIKGKGKLTGKAERRELSLKAQNVVIDGKKLASVNLDLDQQNSSCVFRLKGDGILNQVSARLSGKLDRIWDFPYVSVSTQGQLDWKELSGAVDARFDIEKEGIRIHSASFQHGREKIVVSGGTISESKTELLLSLESINVARISALLDRKDLISGAVSGQIQVSGRPDQPEFRLNIQGHDCVVHGKQHIEALSLQGNYSKEILVVQGTAKAAAVRNPMMISARLPVRLSFKPPQFELRLSEEFQSDIRISGLNAAELLPFLGFLTKAGGQLDGDIHCAGNLKQPVVSGAGTWKDGFFQEKQWPHAAENIQADWQIDSKSLYVKKAEVTHLGGTVSVTGKVDFPQFKTLDFRAEGRDLQVHDIYGIEGKVSGNAEIKNSSEAALLTGTLVFSNARMSLGKLETNIAQNIQIIEPNARGDLLELRGSKNPSQFYNRLTMDVMLQLPQSGTWVTGKGLKAEINGSLKLKKDPAGPVRLAGELNALRGSYNFQGKELKIAEGSLIFTGAPQTEPQLRILCRKDIRDVTVQALISGPLGHSKVVLSSIPAMNQVDILSYFMFDRPAGDISTSQSSQLQTGAAAWLGSESSDIIKSVLGNNILTPDAVGYRSYTGKYDHRFSFDQSQAAAGKETGIVEIGKDVTPDLHVVYGREIKGTEGNEVQVEYRVNKGVSLRTQVGAEQSGLDIFWRHDFGK